MKTKNTDLYMLLKIYINFFLHVNILTWVNLALKAIADYVTGRMLGLDTKKERKNY